MPTEQKVKRKLRAILSADVKGYSLLMADDEIHTIETLKAYRQIMSKYIQQHSGRVVDSPGDNLLAEFGSAVDAVQCAVEVQKQLQRENARYVEEKRVQFRIGVNVGDVIQDGDRIYGNGVNVAARIEGLADPGGVCISRNAYDHIKNKLRLGYEYLGDHEVKNIKDPVRVYKVLLDSGDAGKLIGDEPKPVAKNWIWVTIVVAAIVVTSISWLVYHNITKPDIEPASIDAMAYLLPDKASIAVLPFRNMSQDSSKEYMADGLTENIITHLAKLPELFVISRESSFFYKNKAIKIKQVSEELGVRYVLEGSIIVAGDNIRVTAQLIDAISGHHVWAQDYDRKLVDLFSLFDDITLAILKEMHVDIQVGYKGLGSGTDNIDAFLKVIEGRYHYLFLSKENNSIARKLFEEAILLDPDYAAAYAYLGSTYYVEAVFLWSTSSRESMEKAEQYVQKSIEIDDSFWLSHSFLAQILIKSDAEKGLAESKKALELGSGVGIAYIVHSERLRLSGKGNSKIELEYAEKGRRLNPNLSAFGRYVLAVSYYNTGRYQDTITISKTVLEDNYRPPTITALLLLAYLELGMIEEAKLYAVKLMDIKPDFQIPAYVRSERLRTSVDVNDLTALVKDILYPGADKANIFFYDKKPNFQFQYPARYKEFKKFLDDQIIVLITPNANICFVALKKISENQTLDNLWDAYTIHVMESVGSKFTVKHNEDIVLKCGTPAKVLDVEWQYLHREFYRNRFLHAIHSGTAVVATISRRLEEDDDLSWINSSLTFEEKKNK